MNEELRGQVAIVTGASRGIGRAIAVRIAAHGARLALAARSAGDLEEVRRQITAAGNAALAIPTDVTDEVALRRLVKATLAEWGRLDILINCAGIGPAAPLAETSTELWDQVFAVNARAPFVLCREALPALTASGAGRIINIASNVAVKGYPSQGAYSASKHALLGMSKVLAQEVQRVGIRVHVVCPGGVDTEMISRIRPDIDRAALMSPQDVADAVLFLLGQRGNALTDILHVRRAAAPPAFD